MTKVSDHRTDRTPSTTPFQNHSNHRRPLHQDREICIAKCLNACSQRSNIGSTTFELTNGIELTYIGCSVHNRDLRIRCHLVFVQQVSLTRGDVQ
ncbi:hypothetical protein TWF569_004633 [Orbilia oligospora]|uniref:Uncharacterized protein n=1 Tax=Orbilia oligospora TaxID=2813651 RepID=A0A7C8N2W3_ORBOL|nr:hypothetical protein TWF102_010372 [Orbilia oligospora]KAF3118874.1 hypothetical protein TWF569_004633 [Orbilia oligospora]